MIVDKEGKLFENRRKKDDRRKQDVKVKEERRKCLRRSQDKK